MDEGHSMLWGKLGGIWKPGPQEAGISGREELASVLFRSLPVSGDTGPIHVQWL